VTTVGALRVKICGIGSLAEARLAVEAGASAIGLVSAMPSGPGVISDELIAAIAATVPPPVATFLLTSLTEPEAIIEQHGRCLTSVIQLVDALTAAQLGQLRAGLPGIGLVQVIHVTGEEALEQARAVAPYASALLLDSGNPGATVPEFGGTGRVHDWALSRRIVEASPVPVFLAGGLCAENVGAAIVAVRPFAVDVCSGVREGGRLNGERLRALFCAVAEGNWRGRQRLY
jgi:phosphoribosylanthranilate isomerase